MEIVRLTRATWEVRWVHDRKIILVNYKDDFAEALRIYTKAIASGRRDVTLRSRNVGFAPPQRLRPYTKSPSRREPEPPLIDPLEHYNHRGWWWCPYCIHLRKFGKRNGFYMGRIWVPEPGYCCPMCGISHRDNAVKTWNPLARRLQEEGVQATHKRKRVRT